MFIVAVATLYHQRICIMHSISESSIFGCKYVESLGLNSVVTTTMQISIEESSFERILSSSRRFVIDIDEP